MNQDEKEPELYSIVPSERFERLRLLGSGFSGKVYAARDLTTSSSVILKLIYLRNRESHARLKREMSLLHNLPPSKHVARLFDSYFSRDGDRAVLVSEYVDGLNLETLVESHNEPLPELVVASIARQLCEGLVFLHHHNVVHRDIKPSNILIGLDGIVKFCDFGIAISAAKEASGTTITRDDTFVGTIRYAAPEIISGEKFGTPVDVYSLGVTLTYILLGRQPLENASVPFLIRQVLSGRILDEIPSSQDSFWWKIVSSCLDPRPEHRPSAAELLTNFDQAFRSAAHDSSSIANFLQGGAGFKKPPPPPPTAISSAPETPDDGSLRSSVQSLALQVVELQAVVTDATAAFKKQRSAEISSLSDRDATVNDIERTFQTVRDRLAVNWRFAVFTTATLFCLFVGMIFLAVICGVVYQKSQWGIVFGGTSVASLVTVVLWKPMDKMLSVTIASQQLELIQVNYRRALTGSRIERREAFRDVSTQLMALLSKCTPKTK